MTSSRAGKIHLVQVGRQAFGVARPAAGKAGVEQGATGVARKRGGLGVFNSKGVGKGVRAVAQARRVEAEEVTAFRLPDHPKRRVVCEGGMFWMDAAVCRNKGGGWPADIAGFLPHCAQGLVMLFGQVVVTVQVPAPRKAS